MTLTFVRTSVGFINLNLVKFVSHFRDFHLPAHGFTRDEDVELGIRITMAGDRWGMEEAISLKGKEAENFLEIVENFVCMSSLEYLDPDPPGVEKPAPEPDDIPY